jgi:hypothetical protein
LGVPLIQHPIQSAQARRLVLAWMMILIRHSNSTGGQTKSSRHLVGVGSFNKHCKFNIIETHGKDRSYPYQAS